MTQKGTKKDGKEDGRYLTKWEGFKEPEWVDADVVKGTAAFDKYKRKRT